jgi:hypothetical protein
MLGIIVVPRNAVVTQKCEKGVAVLDESLSNFQCRVALKVRLIKISVEPIDPNEVFS